MLIVFVNFLHYYVAYMAEKKGKPSHRTLLKMDIDDAKKEAEKNAKEKTA